jgi:hypothetical protein
MVKCRLYRRISSDVSATSETSVASVAVIGISFAANGIVRTAPAPSR